MTKVRVRAIFVKNIYNETRCCRKMTKAMTSFVLNLDFDKKKKEKIILMVANGYLIAGSTRTHNSLS
jgi:hypothetical protein